jgi:hypothetical protein
MKPDLNVQSYESESSDAHPSLQVLKAWLISATDPSLASLNKRVRQLHYLSCTDDERLDLLDRFRPMISRAGSHLRERLQDSQLPLARALVDGLDNLAKVHSIVADVYKLVLLNQSAALMHTGRSSDTEHSGQLRDLVLACYGAINHLAEQLRAVYEAYSPPPAGVWREVHQIYQFAHTIINSNAITGIDGRTGMDEFFMIEHIYKRALLLGLCNPFHFSFRQFGDLNRTLNSRASLCVIHFETMSAEKLNLFSIDFDSDYPAAPVLTRSGQLLQGKHYAVLDTRELTDSINHEIDMIAGEAFAEPGQYPREERLQKLDMLRRLVMNWGQHPVRRDQRSDVEDGQCRVAIGFSDIVTHVSRNGELFDRMASTNRDTLEQGGDIIDSSQMGYQLALRADSHLRFQIGEMLAVRDIDDADSWSPCIIRWARYLDSERIGIGVFILGSQCQRIRVRSADRTKGQGADCLKLTRSISLPMSRKLMIAPSSLYRPDATLQMTDGHSMMIRAGNMLLLGIDFVVFDYEYIDWPCLTGMRY